MTKDQKIRPSLLQSACQIWLFIALGGLAWWIFNDFNLYATEGFDPLRYEYYARFGTPNYLLDSTSYRIVSILSFLYRFLPYYTGFLFFISIIAILLRQTDASYYISTAIFSPVSFYYLSQTGKDGIAILALIGMMMISFEPRKISQTIVCASVLLLSMFIRPAIALYLPLIGLQTRFGTRSALLACLPLILFFNYSVDIYGVTSGVDDIANDAGAGSLALLLRRYTLGYQIIPIVTKIALYMLSPVFQPATALLKYATSGMSFVLLEAATYTAFLLLLWYNKIIIRFFLVSLPYCLVIGSTSPFYHFRYLAVAYPIIFIYAKYSVVAGRNAVRRQGAGAMISQLLRPTKSAEKLALQ